MKKSIFTFIILLYPNLVFEQFLDTFSDRGIANSPARTGNVCDFEADATYNLHLTDRLANISYLSTPIKQSLTEN